MYVHVVCVCVCVCDFVLQHMFGGVWADFYDWICSCAMIYLSDVFLGIHLDTATGGGGRPAFFARS